MMIILDSSRILIKKLMIFLIFYIINYNLWIIFLAPDIYSNKIEFTTLIIVIILAGIDTFIRPIEDKTQMDFYTKLLLFAFFIAPIIVIGMHYEHEIFISELLPILNNLNIAYIGILIVAIGGLITIVARIQLGSYASGQLRLQKKHQLYKSGLYKYIRHPIYMGGYIGMIGVTLAFRSIIVSFLSLIFHFWLYNGRMNYEEEILAEEFGKEYDEYKNQTKKIIPFIF